MNDPDTNEFSPERFNALGTYDPLVHIEFGGKVTIKEDLTVEELREVITRMAKYIHHSMNKVNEDKEQPSERLEWTRQLTGEIGTIIPPCDECEHLSCGIQREDAAFKRRRKETQERIRRGARRTSGKIV